MNHEERASQVWTDAKRRLKEYGNPTGGALMGTVVTGIIAALAALERETLERAAIAAENSSAPYLAGVAIRAMQTMSTQAAFCANHLDDFDPKCAGCKKVAQQDTSSTE